ncbi:unnamed protein product [Prorocentrum cordatum]|uniref:Uncharacterized protein n=1 Tax=Prorocentrum cordatum TaxID=2364126 RepID=A0ABN9WU01_9DINO|nr:unnamed protein product [Polarella glacialis]
MDAKSLMVKMMRMMKSMSKDMKDARKDSEEAKAIALQAKLAAQMAEQAVEGVKTTVKQTSDEMKAIKKDVEQMKVGPGMFAKAGITRIAEATQSIVRDLRELQVIATGLKDPEDEEEVIKQVKDMVDGLGMGNKYTSIGVFTDPSKIGVVNFKSIASKIGFLKKANISSTQWGNGETMRFKANDTIEKRTVDKELGMIKCYLHEKHDHALEDIVIKWHARVVELKGVKVAWEEDAKGIVYGGAGLAVKASVTGYMKAWREKRNLDDDL